MNLKVLESKIGSLNFSWQRAKRPRRARNNWMLLIGDKVLKEKLFLQQSFEFKLKHSEKRLTWRT